MEIRPPHRVGHAYVQRLDASPDRVFPLLCPVRESEWIADWDPAVVFSASGVAEQDCIFVTEHDGEAIWVVTHHDPGSWTVGFLKVVPGRTVTRIEIALAPRGGDGCDATVRYTRTALTPAGDRDVRDFTAENYAQFMRTWETDLNAYLAARPAST